VLACTLCLSFIARLNRSFNGLRKGSRWLALNNARIWGLRPQPPNLYISAQMRRSNFDRPGLEAVFDDIITGSGVHRSRHDLVIDGRDVTGEFLPALARNGFSAMTVGDVIVQPGERVPAFYIKGSTAYFGWIFWEKFSESKLRKLWGSVVRNAKGDWAIQIPAGRTTTIHAGLSLKIEMDIENPR
jgi:hypothetical protein